MLCLESSSFEFMAEAREEGVAEMAMLAAARLQSLLLWLGDRCWGPCVRAFVTCTLIPYFSTYVKQTCSFRPRSAPPAIV